MKYVFAYLPGYRRGRCIRGTETQILTRASYYDERDINREIFGRSPRISATLPDRPYNMIIARRDDNVLAHTVYSVRWQYHTGEGTVFDLTLDASFTLAISAGLRSSFEIDTTRYSAPDADTLRNLEAEPLPEIRRTFGTTSSGTFNPTYTQTLKSTANAVCIVVTATADPLTGEAFRTLSQTVPSPFPYPAIYTPVTSSKTAITATMGDPQSYVLEIMEKDGVNETFYKACPQHLTHYVNTIKNNAAAFGKIVKIQIVPTKWLTLAGSGTGEIYKADTSDYRIELLPDAEAGKEYYFAYRHVKPSTSGVSPFSASVVLSDVAKATYFNHTFAISNNGVPILKIPAEYAVIDTASRKLTLNNLKVYYTINNGLNFYLRYGFDDTLSATVTVPDLLAVLDNKFDWWVNNGESVGAAGVSAMASALLLATGAATGGTTAAIAGGVGLASSLVGQGLGFASSFGAATRAASKTAGTNTAGQNAAGSGRNLLEAFYDFDYDTDGMTAEEYYRRYGYACRRHFDTFPAHESGRAKYYYIEGSARINPGNVTPSGRWCVTFDELNDAIAEEMNDGVTVYAFDGDNTVTLGEYPAQ